MGNFRFLLIALTICLVKAGLCFSQESFNLIRNSDFEEPLGDTNWKTTEQTASRSTEERIERAHGAVLDHGSTIQTSRLFQDIHPSNFDVGDYFIISANVRMDSGTAAQTERIQIKLRFHGSTELDQNLSWLPGTNRNWAKLSQRIQIPPIPDGKSAGFRIMLRALNTSGKTCFDLIQMIPADPVLDGPTGDGMNMLANGCFDYLPVDPWNFLTPGITVDETESYFGARSLRIEGVSGEHRQAAQTIELGDRGFAPDAPIYTFATHIKTSFTGTPPPRAIHTDYWNRVPVDPEMGESPDPTLPQVPTLGASITIGCYDDNVLLRKLYFPFHIANFGEFVERKFSFLVPEGTNSLRIMPGVDDIDMIAWFDNFRLLKNNPVGPEELVAEVGPYYGSVEAPELGTSVTANDYTDLQSAIDDVCQPASDNYGRIVWVPAVTYFDNLRRIRLKTGLHLKMHKDAHFFRSHEDPEVNNGLYSSMWHGAFFKNRKWYTPISDVIIEGGTFYNDTVVNHDGNSYTNGSVIANCCDRFVIRNVKVGSHGVPDGVHAEDSSSAFYLLGHDIYIHNNRIVSPAGYMGKDGVHLWGGGRLHVMSNDIETGDDALAVASSPNSILFDGDQSQVITNRDLQDVEIYNNTLFSHNARVLHAGMANSVIPPSGPYARMTNTIQNIRFRNFVGQCGGTNQMINIAAVPAPTTTDPNVWWPFTEGEFVPPQIRNILISNGDIQGSDQLYLTQRRPPVGLRIRSDDVGSVYNVRFDNVRVRNVAPQFDGTTLLQSAKVFAIEKSVWYEATQDRIDLVGHDNRRIICSNCVFDAISLDENDEPDGGIDADFLYFVDGLKHVEANEIEAPEFNNLFNSYSPDQPGPGLRHWAEEHHSAHTAENGDVNVDGTVNLLDVGPFLDVLIENTFQYEADCNDDGNVDLLDVTPFIEILAGD